MYTPFKPYNYNECNETRASNRNKWFAADFAHVHGLKTKLEERGIVRKFYRDETFVGMVHTFPSNNGKFYAVNSRHEDGLFITFEEACKFAIN